MGLIEIAIADSQMLTKEGIISVLKATECYDIVSSVETKDELFELLKHNTPSILIIDPDQLKDFMSYHFPELIKRYPVSSILVLTSNINRDFILRILATGITHFMLKICTIEELLNALVAIGKNEKYLCKKVIEMLISENITLIRNKDKDASLTKKEIEIIKLIAQGLTTKEIAAQNFISVHTVNTHRKNILRKLRINNTSELVMYAVKAGIIDTTEYYI